MKPDKKMTELEKLIVDLCIDHQPHPITTGALISAVKRETGNKVSKEEVTAAAINCGLLPCTVNVTAFRLPPFHKKHIDNMPYPQYQKHSINI